MTQTTARKLFSRGEVLTLIGLGLVVVSAAMTWGQEAPPVTSMVGVVFSENRNFYRNGYELKMGWMRVGWAVVICAVACGSLLLFEPSGKEKRAFFAIQVALGGIIIALALLHIGPYIGVFLALLGGACLIAGAAVKYR